MAADHLPCLSAKNRLVPRAVIGCGGRQTDPNSSRFLCVLGDIAVRCFKIFQARWMGMSLGFQPPIKIMALEMKYEKGRAMILNAAASLFHPRLIPWLYVVLICNLKYEPYWRCARLGWPNLASQLLM
ncbi:hypothetical protein EYB31_33180 [Paenibacillus thalictri]|uniref:Uncharacterized protein n=1 Tax=Paenibacillus thalictri TaxID=2527873 RepID=A0A4V2J378_9BACL|nr:hypothetical protein EYB31_33180 [Paenibacillus thalictri]